MRALMYMMRAVMAVVLMGCFVLPVGAQETYKVGSAVKSFTAKDQFDRAYTFRKGPKYLLVSFDMENYLK